MILDYAHVSSEVSFLEELEEYQCVASRKKGRIGNLHSYWVANIQRYNIHKQSPRISIPVFIAVSIVTMRVQFGHQQSICLVCQYEPIPNKTHGWIPCGIPPLSVTSRTRWEEKFTEILQILEFCTLESNYQTNLTGNGHRRENQSCRYQYGVYPDIPIFFLRNVWCVPGGWIAGVFFSSFFSMNITNFGTNDTEDCKCVTVRFDSLIHCTDKSRDRTNVHDCDVFDCNQKLFPRFFFVD